MNFHSLFGLKSHTKPPPAKAKARTIAAEGPPTIEDGSANALRRQLVQVLLRDVVRRHGIPAGWLDCQMLVVSSRSRGEGMYVRLVMKHWDSRLLNYAVAFQKALMVDIMRFEPHAADWLYGISWQLEVGDTCPYKELPDRSAWAEPSQRPDPQIELKTDLERIFAIRDSDMLMRGEEAPARAYAKTEPQKLVNP
ncbi:MAG: hypothetical protein Q8R06_00320 [Polaromonas sp.]|uniref:hypothetical protein n=1 Tax=Polaromonas sp. TaxID=1869339 RepID=UPI002732520A|nr:hypothetical protein [Polaromonas sp.]MDP3795582.1 hypothetical protein [Polaromonas sp.]